MYNVSIRGLQKSAAPATRSRLYNNSSSAGNALGNAHSIGSDENLSRTTRMLYIFLRVFYL